MFSETDWRQHVVQLLASLNAGLGALSWMLLGVLVLLALILWRVW